MYTVVDVIHRVMLILRPSLWCKFFSYLWWHLVVFLSGFTWLNSSTGYGLPTHILIIYIYFHYFPLLIFSHDATRYIFIHFTCRFQKRGRYIAVEYWCHYRSLLIYKYTLVWLASFLCLAPTYVNHMMNIGYENILWIN